MDRAVLYAGMSNRGVLYKAATHRGVLDRVCYTEVLYRGVLYRGVLYRGWLYRGYYTEGCCTNSIPHPEVWRAQSVRGTCSDHRAVSPFASCAQTSLQPCPAPPASRSAHPVSEGSSISDSDNRTIREKAKCASMFAFATRPVCCHNAGGIGTGVECSCNFQKVSQG